MSDEAAAPRPVPQPIIVTTERLSDTILLHVMSDDAQLFGCSWPGCGFTSGNPRSIPAHYKTHAGQAAQRRRAQRRPRSAEISNEVLEAAFALLDRAQDLIDRLDSFDAEFTKTRRDLDEAKIKLEEYREREEDVVITADILAKAAKYDRLMEALSDAQT